jgi:hypothetical protein
VVKCLVVEIHRLRLHLLQEVTKVVTQGAMVVVSRHHLLLAATYHSIDNTTLTRVQCRDHSLEVLCLD